MNEEIKEMNLSEMLFNRDEKLLDYITNLQQAIEIKNQRIKEEQQEKERYIKSYNGLNTWNKELQQENENLKQTLHNITINGVEEENTSVLDLIKENERLKVQLNGCDELLDNDMEIIDKYKSRCEEAIEYIENHNIPYTSYLGEPRKVNKLEIKDGEYNRLLNILNGSGENETNS